MNDYDLDLYVRWDPVSDPAGVNFLDAYAERLFDLFEGDVAPAVTAGRPCIGGTVEAESLGDAVRRLVDAAEGLGLVPERVEIHGTSGDVPPRTEAVGEAA